MAMVSLSGPGQYVPLCLPVDQEGVVWIQESMVSHRFCLVRSSIWIEREIYADDGKKVVATVLQIKQVKEAELTWRLPSGNYRVFGESVVTASLQTPELGESTVQTSFAAHVKVESSEKDTIVLTDSSDDEVVYRLKPDYSFLSPITETILELPKTGSESLSSLPSLNSRPPLPPKPESFRVLECLRQLQNRPRGKSDLKMLNLDTLRCERVQYLPAEFNGDVLFEFPPVSNSTLPSSSRHMEGMDKRYDRHAWTKTYTTNIVNEFGLIFRSSNCVGHIQCTNEACARLHRKGSQNETDWEGSSQYPFAIGDKAPQNSSIVRRICKCPPSCLHLCPC